MPTPDIFAQLKASLTLMNLVTVAVRVIFIALLFEGLAWWLTRQIERYIAPLITLDAGREHSWRVRRRTLLRQTPRTLIRTLCYLGALIAVLSVFEGALPSFSIPVLPVAIVVGALIVVFGIGAIAMIQDAVQGYSLLAEDAIAIGDVLEIDSQRGTVHGIVERFSPRGVWLRDGSGKAHNIANREIRHVVMHRRKEERNTE
jgi:small-conductance mechanosensitive channel